MAANERNKQKQKQRVKKDMANTKTKPALPLLCASVRCFAFLLSQAMNLQAERRRCSAKKKKKNMFPNASDLRAEAAICRCCCCLMAWTAWNFRTRKTVARLLLKK